MRFATVLGLTLILCGCSEHLPTGPIPPVAPPPVAPPPAPPQRSDLAALWGYIVGPTGDCIEGATAEVVAGPVLVGQKATQVTPCDDTRFTGGFMFDDGVPIAIEMTLRFTAPGYASKVQVLNTYSETVPRFTLVPVGLSH